MATNIISHLVSMVDRMIDMCTMSGIQRKESTKDPTEQPSTELSSVTGAASLNIPSPTIITPDPTTIPESQKYPRAIYAFVKHHSGKEPVIDIVQLIDKYYRNVWIPVDFRLKGPSEAPASIQQIDTGLQNYYEDNDVEYQRNHEGKSLFMEWIEDNGYSSDTINEELNDTDPVNIR